MDVVKLHYFPRNPKRSKTWLEAMGIKYAKGNIRYLRICSTHFTPESYTFESSFILISNAVPSLHPVQTISKSSDSHLQEESCIRQRLPLQTIENNAVIDCNSPAVPVEHPSAAIQFASYYPTTQVNIPSTSTQVNIPSTSTQVNIPSTTVKRRKSYFKDMPNLTNATPTEKALVNVIRKKHDHIRKLKSICKKRGHTIKNICKLNLNESSIVKDIFKGISPSAQSLLFSQLLCAKRLPKGRRWTAKEKVLALAVYKKSPKCYTLLRRLITLPSIRTLSAVLEDIPFETGINPNIFVLMDNCLKNTNQGNRLCTLMFDEMAIREHIYYDKIKDRIVGFEDLGNGSISNKIAKNALVFMAQGCRRNWKQPVAFYFTHGGITSDQLKVTLLEVLNAMEKANLHVVATVCDMGSANVKMLKTMGSTVEHPYFLYNERKIYNIFDVCHLLKCIRNLFRKYNIQLTVPLLGEQTVMQARWSDIQTVYSIDNQTLTPFRSMPKLREAHLNPTIQQTMKVKLAAQVMSHTVSAFIYCLVSKNSLPQRALATATLISQVDELFDSLNGSGEVTPDGKQLCCYINENTGHVEYWKKVFKIVQDWNIIRKPSDSDRPGKKPPSQIGWLHTLRAMQVICQGLLKKLNYIRPRTFNQDSLENLFGAIRSGCGSNENPTVNQFIGSLKTQVINGLVKQGLQGNCEEDDATILTNLNEFLEITKRTSDDTPEETSLDTLEDTTTDYVHQAHSFIGMSESILSGHIDSFSVAYVSGYIAKRILAGTDCPACHFDLKGDPNTPSNQSIYLL